MFDPNVLAVQIVTAAPVFLFSLVFHEYSHALVAHRLGDRLAAWSGRLTLDPRPHVDPLGSIVMPLAGLALGGFIFGWARPVPVNPRDLKNRSRDMALIALAGPVSNLLLLIACAFLMRGLMAAGATEDGLSGIALRMAAFGVYINALLAIFNMIPLPPLDGSKVLAHFLGPETGRRLLGINSGLSFLFLMFLVFQGYLSKPLFMAIQCGAYLAGMEFGEVASLLP
ncbi:MAG: site-2 protease family protein [Myxococcota bacterium]|nr:site-2 protease family protein [Myxococcota bacterium]